MSETIYRVAIVGASSLAGKELSDVLSDSPLAVASFALFDEDEVAGQLSAAADEISFVRRLDETSFEGIHLVFFAGDPAVARRYLAAARRAGADVIDLTGGLEGAPGAVVSVPRLLSARPASEAPKNGGSATAGPRVIIPAHPAAQMLAEIMSQLNNAFGAKCLAATVLLPASEYGRSAVDELHRQTVSLLAFQPVAQEQFDVQVAFNLVAEFGEVARVSLSDLEQRIARHYRTLMPEAPELSLQVVQAPVFHGIAASVFVELSSAATAAALGELFPLPTGVTTAPTPLSVTGESVIAVRPRLSADCKDGTRVELWAAADNLRLHASNAVECALALRDDQSFSRNVH